MRQRAVIAAAHVLCLLSLSQIDPFIVNCVGESERLEPNTTPKTIIERALEETILRRQYVKRLLSEFSCLV